MSVIISDVEHENGDKLQYAIDFYNQIVDDEYEVVLQSEKLSEYAIIEIEGRVFENYEKILPNPVPIKTYRIPVNDYHIISHLEDTGIDVTEDGIVNVSANGNIFIDAEPYECVDAHPMFNIMDCNNDFWMRLENWCWKYRYGVSAKNEMEVYNTIKFCEQKGLSVSVSEIMKQLKRYMICLWFILIFLKNQLWRYITHILFLSFQNAKRLQRGIYIQF